MKTRTVVLTFDDAVANHATLASSRLLHYGFGATFYVCEFPPDFAVNKQQYMTWEQIAGLHADGFEIGNHTAHHAGVGQLTPEQLCRELDELEALLTCHGIARSTTFAYPGGPGSEPAKAVLRDYGFRWARGVDPHPFVPGRDDPMYVPSFPVHGEDRSKFYDAVAMADGKAIPVLLFHGIPEYAHPWVNTPPELFEEYLSYLADNDFTVIAMRDLPVPQ